MTQAAAWVLPSALRARSKRLSGTRRVAQEESEATQVPVLGQPVLQGLSASSPLDVFHHWIRPLGRLIGLLRGASL